MQGCTQVGCAPARCFGVPVTSGGLRSPNYNIVKTRHGIENSAAERRGEERSAAGPSAFSALARPHTRVIAS